MNPLRAIKKILHFDRRLRRLKNRIGGSSGSRWVEDLVSAISYVDFLKTLLILTVATLAPRHFFKNLPQYVLHPPMWFKTPIAFLTSSATLMGLLLIASKPAALENTVSDQAISGWPVLLGLLITMPVTMALVCLGYWLLLIVLYPVPSVRRLKDVRTRMLLPWSRALYSLISWKQLTPRLIYFNIYVIFAGVVSEIALLIIILIFLGWLSLGLAAIAFFTSAIFANYLLIVRPYITLLSRSALIPTERMLRADCYELARLAGAFQRSWSKGRPASAVKALARLRRRVRFLESEASRHDRNARLAGADYVDQLEAARASVAGSRFDVDRSRDVPSAPEQGSLLASMNATLDRFDAWRFHKL